MLEDYFQGKKINYLVIVLVVVALFILLREMVLKKEVPVPENVIFLPQIKIDFQVLEDEELKELSYFETLSLPEEFGRENPFVPYEE